MTFNKREYQKRYYQEHKEHIDELKRKWRGEHAEEINRRKRESYYKNHERNKELARISWKKYRENNLDRVRTLVNARNKALRKRKKDYIMWYNTKYLEEHKCYTEDNYTCPECGKEIDVAQVHNHHVEPESKLFNIANYRHHSWEELENELPKTIPICPECHKIITAKERNHYIFQGVKGKKRAELKVIYLEQAPHFERRRQK